MFREPEKRPPAVVSNLFTLLAVLPFVIFLGLVNIVRLKLNNSKMHLLTYNLFSLDLETRTQSICWLLLFECFGIPLKHVR